MGCYSGLWKVRSKGAILTLSLDILVFTAFLSLLWMLNEIKYDDRYYIVGQQGSLGVILGLLTVSCPVAGWLADVYFGRYKVLQFGLWMMWTGLLCMSVAFLLAYELKECTKCLFFVFSSIALVGSMLIDFGFAAYAVNAVQFGIDQMPDASSEELSAYIHWFVWTLAAGGATSGVSLIIRYCAIPQSNCFLNGAIQLMVPTTMLSLALCCKLLLYGWLIIEPGSPNSLRMIYRILKFAVNNNHPLRRRAITYTEDEKPFRIDFAKDKYGGPFTTEQVEDVKTFLRIIVVIIATATGIVPLILLITSETYFTEQLVAHTCSAAFQAVGGSVPSYSVVIIPLYTFILYPFLKNKILSMLQRVAISASITVILTGAVFIIDTIRHEHNPHNVCIFQNQFAIANYVHSNPWIVPLHQFILAVEAVLYLVAILEFTCAQSPYHMRGLVIGLMYSVFFLTFFIANGIFLAWTTVKTQKFPGCEFYYFLFQFLCAVIGLIVLCIVARWYKRKRREEEDDQRRIVEGIYDRLLTQQNQIYGMQKEVV